MRFVALLFLAVIFALDSGAAQAQWSRGGSGGGWGGSAGTGQWGAPAGQPSQGRQRPATPPQPPTRPQQQPSWSFPAQKPPVQVIPGRPGLSHTPQKPRGVVPPPSGSRWNAPFWSRLPNHWRRDRFFRHRHGGVILFGVPQFVGTTVITEVAPGVIREERRYVENSTAGDPVRDPGQLAPYDPTPQEVVERMLALANVRKNDVVYDLGSGDGRLLITAAKKYGARGVGFEIEPGLVKLARENARREGVEKLISIRQQDFLSADLSPASVVTLYLSFDGNLAVREQLNRQLKPGTRVVSYTFDMGDWPPKIAESYRDAAGETHAIYLWQITEPASYSQSSSEMLSPQPPRDRPLIIEVQ